MTTIKKELLIEISKVKPACFLLVNLDEEKINFNELYQFDCKDKKYKDLKFELENNPDKIIVVKNFTDLGNVELNVFLSDLLNNIHETNKKSLFFLHNEKINKPIPSSFYKKLNVFENVYEEEVEKVSKIKPR